MTNENNDFLSIYNTISEDARAIWEGIEAVADDIESAPQDVLAEVMRLTAAWGAEPSTAQGVMLGAIYITHLHRLGGLTPKTQTNASRDLERFVSLLIHKAFKRDGAGRLPSSAIMPAIRGLLAEDARLAHLADDCNFSVASHNAGYRLLKRLLVDGATRVTNGAGRESLHGWALKLKDEINNND